MVGIRSGRTHLAQVDGVKIYTTVNRDAAGKISEVFVTTDREGTTIMGLLNSLSKTISVMLQYDIPPQSISKMLRGQKYEPYGFVQSHPNIKYVTSISDLISKIIDIELGDYTRVQVKPADACVPAALSEEDEVATVATASAASGAEDELEPVVTPEAMEHLREEKEDELREEVGSVDMGDFYTSAFVNERAREAAQRPMPESNSSAACLLVSTSCFTLRSVRIRKPPFLVSKKWGAVQAQADGRAVLRRCTYCRGTETPIANSDRFVIQSCSR